MEQSPSWEANWFAASQEIPHVLWNPKVPHRTHNRPTPIPILSQPNPVPTPTSHFLKIHPNIILSSKPRSPQRSLSLRLPHQNPYTPLLSPIRATCPAHPNLLDFITRTMFHARGTYLLKTAITGWRKEAQSLLRYRGEVAKTRCVWYKDTTIRFTSSSLPTAHVGPVGQVECHTAWITLVWKWTHFKLSKHL
jgi:hypothetical protein